MKIEYEYISFGKSENIYDCLAKVQKICNEGGWRIVSHSTSLYGVSFILEREK